MKIKTPQISWHNREPLFAVDTHPSGKIATAGADNEVKIWKLENIDSTEVVTFLASLNRHIKTVNAVRFSPDGRYLASGGDDGFIFIWQYNPNINPAENNSSMLEEKEYEDKESWTVAISLKGPGSTDVYDISWAPDSMHLITASTDNTALVWDLATAKVVQQLTDHSHYVQGVAWDPRGVYIATQSCDRTCKIFTKRKERQKEKYQCIISLNKRESDEGNDENCSKNVNQIVTAPAEQRISHRHKMFEDETINSFFRRLAWSPDGSLLVTPSGLFQQTPTSTVLHTSYVFTRGSLSKPVMYLPGPQKATVAVRFNPVLFKRRKDTSSEQSLFKLDYRMIFAIGTLDGIIVYDSEELYPIAYADSVHYAEITDLAWTSDGTTLLVTSKDGYITIISFEQSELGEQYKNGNSLQSKQQ